MYVKRLIPMFLHTIVPFYCLQAYIEVKCLEETLKLYINEGAR